MDNVWEALTKRIQELGAQWPSYTVLGGFTLYVLGYLSLRFHLSALGIGTDLSVLDERYLFTGAKFLIYLCTTAPSLILLSLILVVPGYGLFLLCPSPIKAKLGNAANAFCGGWHNGNRLALFGIMFSLLIIQLVMRQCFLLNNLLLADDLPAAPRWFRDLLLQETDGLMALYFCALLAAAMVTSWVVFLLSLPGNLTRSARPLKVLLIFLLIIQWLLLPINYGILVVDKAMPQVTGLAAPGSLKKDEQAWLVWEGDAGLTFLVRKQRAGQYQKSLITLPRASVKQVEISGYKRIFVALFAPTTHH